MPELASSAMIPNPHLDGFKPLIGAWTTTGHHALMPGVELRGRASFEWHEGGAFVIMRTEIDEPRIPSGISIFGSDDDAGTFTMLYFDERRVSRRYEVAIENGVLKWWRNAPGFSQRYALSVSPNGVTLHSAGELSRDRATWNPDLELSYERVK